MRNKGLIPNRTPELLVFGVLANSNPCGLTGVALSRAQNLDSLESAHTEPLPDTPSWVTNAALPGSYTS